MVNRSTPMRIVVMLHRWRGCQVTCVDLVALRPAALTSRSSSGDSGVMEPVARQCFCKHGDYATMWAAFGVDRADGL
jgi:hypothetical protein